MSTKFKALAVHIVCKWLKPLAVGGGGKLFESGYKTAIFIHSKHRIRAVGVTLGLWLMPLDIYR